MKKEIFRRAACGALLLAMTVFAACNGSDDNGDTPANGGGNNGGGATPDALYLRVSPETLTFNGDGTAEEATAFIVETNGTWQAAAGQDADWVRLSDASGTGSGTVAVTIPAPVKGGGRAEVTFTARDAEGATQTRTVFVVQKDPAAPGPGDYTIDLDFAVGPKLSEPELPGSSAEALNDRKEYEMEGHTFAIHADGSVNGKYFWVDNSQYSPSIPEPNKGLYFSKEGAYVEFPAIAGKALSKVVYTPTTSANGDLVLEMTDTEDTMVNHTLEYADDGSSVFTLVTPAANTRYRLEVINSKNAQAAQLVLTYSDAK